MGGGYGSYDFYAFDAATGRRVWKLHTEDDGPTAAIVVDGRVCFNTESCTIYVVAADSGEVVWSRWLGDPLMAQPAADRERVYMAWPSKRGNHVVGAFALATGEPCWEAPIGHDIITAPVIHDGKLYMSAYDGRISRFDASTGRLEWSRDERATSAPWVEGEEILVSRRQEGTDTPFEAVQRNRAANGVPLAAVQNYRGAAYLASKRYTAESRVLDTLDASVGFSMAPEAARLGEVESLTGEYRVYGGWRYQGSRPVVSGGRCTTIVGDGIECVDLGSGARKWARAVSAGDEPSIRQLNPPAAANGRLFFATAGGRLDCLEQEDGKELWSFDVGSPMEWSPSIAGGRLYAGTAGGELVCVETGDRADDGWPMWGGGPGHNGPEGS